MLPSIKPKVVANHTSTKNDPAKLNCWLVFENTRDDVSPKAVGDDRYLGGTMLIYGNPDLVNHPLDGFRAKGEKGKRNRMIENRPYPVSATLNPLLLSALATCSI